MGQALKKIRNVRRKDERPREILEAALDAFAINGYAGTRLDDVAERAGICKGTIYLYFSSKEELFHEVVRFWILPQLERIEEVRKKPGVSAREILLEQLTIIYRNLVSTEARSIPKLIIAEGNRFPELARFYYEEIISRWHQNLRALIKQGVQSGEFRKEALDWQPQAVFSPALSAALWKSVFEPYAPLDLELFLETHIDLLMHGLLGR
jgi:AcrR family transcriptional regulator